MRQLVWVFLGILFLAGGDAPFGGTPVRAQEEQPAGAAAPAEDAAPADEAPAEDAAAAEEVPPPPPPPQFDKWNDSHSIPRSKVSAVSWLKLFSIWLLFVIWVKS